VGLKAITHRWNAYGQLIRARRQTNEKTTSMAGAEGRWTASAPRLPQPVDEIAAAMMTIDADSTGDIYRADHNKRW
jgi:hypothetical protein